jgi:hypothetical protein
LTIKYISANFSGHKTRLKHVRYPCRQFKVDRNGDDVIHPATGEQMRDEALKNGASQIDDIFKEQGKDSAQENKVVNIRGQK